MTITTSTRTAGPFVCNGVLVDFPFPYKVFSRADVLVATTVTATGIETIKTLDADYTVTLNTDQNSSPGGVIHFNVAPPAGTTLAATSNIAIIQALDLTNGGGFYPAAINNALDRIVINIQQLAAKVGAGALNIGSAATIATVLNALTNLASATGSGLVGFLQAAAGAVLRTVQDKLYESVSVMDFMSAAEKANVRSGAGTLNVTAAINTAIAYVKTLPQGGEVFFPVGTYAVTEINATSATADFSKTVKLRGVGRFMSRIVPFSAGGVMLNMMGSNNMHVESLHFAASALPVQCAIFIARTTTSANCNNNKFTDVYIEGSYSVASVVNNGGESSNWFGGRIENGHSGPSYCCMWSGGSPGIKALQNIVTVNGGVVLDNNNPNTDNKMFGTEFYAPYPGARPVRFSRAASYQMFGCAIITGSSDNCHLVTYGDQAGARFSGPIEWHGCHLESFGTGNVVHYLDCGGAQVTFNGISSSGGYVVASNNTALIDFDRTNIANQPIFEASTWTTASTAPNSTGMVAYLYGLFSSNFSFKPNGGDGTLILSGYAQQSVIDVTYYLGAVTRFVGCTHESVATAIPTTGTYTVGEKIVRETPAVGQPLGWRCTVSGTLGALNGGATTGSIANGSNVLTLSSAAGAAEGQRIAIAGVSAGPYYIRKLVGVTAYLDANANATVAGAAVSFSSATLVALPNL